MNIKYGFMKVASAIPAVRVGDVIFNTQQIEEQIALAEGKGVDVITFPELSITGYTCQDLFRQQILLEATEQSIMMLLDFTRKLDIIAIVGAPVVTGDLLSLQFFLSERHMSIKGARVLCKVRTAPPALSLKVWKMWIIIKQACIMLPILTSTRMVTSQV